MPRIRNIDKNNANPKPFVWTKSAEEIPKKLIVRDQLLMIYNQIEGIMIVL